MRLYHKICFDNLIDNAIKYSPGSPEVTISTANENNGILISVADRGMGISTENQQNIFRRFYRVHTGNIHNIKGFGLGLFYVKTMVEAHGGSVSINSELNKGSRFDLFFPFDYVKANPNENEEKKANHEDTAG